MGGADMGHRKTPIPHNRRIGGDRRAPFKQLLGWATARALNSLERHRHPAGAWSIRLKYLRDENHPFPIYTQDPPE